jgi:hypothetical protein
MRGSIRILGIGVLAIMIFAITGYWVHQRFQFFQGKQTEYYGLSIGMSMTEVRDAKGTPTYVLEEPAIEGEGSLVHEANNLNPGENVQNYRQWSFVDNALPDGARLDVKFSNQNNRVERLFCYSEGTRQCPALLGIYDGTTEQKLKERLGAPTTDESSHDMLEKLTYSDLHVCFFLQRQRVFMLGIFDGRQGS